jgi:hypothetical protein
MAPAFLHHAVANAVPRAREALVKGFQWLFGDNETGSRCFDQTIGRSTRSQARVGELDSLRRGALRSIANAAVRRRDIVSHHRRLVLREECRSYELGSILWSFA